MRKKVGIIKGVREIRVKQLDILVFVIILAVSSSLIYAIAPSAPLSFENLSSDSPNPTIGSELNPAGGSISTVNFNAWTQNPRWKGFVGNVSGSYVLADSTNKSLYDWSLVNVKGEIYATRQSGLVDWSNAGCASYENISKEEGELGFLVVDEDNINRTFNNTSHDDFYAGDTYISADNCPSMNLNVNGSAQSTYYQELLLVDEYIIYVSLLEDSEIGYNNLTYDYQMIVPDNTNVSKASETYYFYVELI